MTARRRASMASPITSFPPVIGTRPRLLILGSMPGKASLARGQYYAHPRNAFWAIMERWTGCPATADYADRTEALKRSGVALWDALQSCERASSLDVDIRPASMVPNTIGRLLSRHPSVALILFNGGAAEAVFNKHALPKLSEKQRALPRQRLPSTSPAHAALSLEEKRDIWSRSLREIL